MTAEENYDAAHVTAIDGLVTYASTWMNTDQNYQGVQWDAVRRNLMFMYTEQIPSTPTTNTTGHTLWDGLVSIAPAAGVDPAVEFNTTVGVKNIDTGTVTFYLNYHVDNTVPVGIGGGDGSWRRYTREFRSGSWGPAQPGNGPGMTDPQTGNFWISSESCELYCFRLEDDYQQIISPLFPTGHAENAVKIVGFTDSGATGPWALGREVDTMTDNEVILYLVPREITAAETAADYLLAYAQFTYPGAAYETYCSYNREIFDHDGNMFLFSCAPNGGKEFTLYQFTMPTSAPYGGPTVGGGFTDVTPWAADTGPNADGTDYTLERPGYNLGAMGTATETASVIPLYLPATDDLVLIEKFFPTEKTADSTDPALMFWSCTYVNDPAGSPTFDHHSAFVTGYMDAAWSPTNQAGAAYAVIDAFEVNSYLGQSDYDYTADVTGLDYTKRWFFFVCHRMTAGVSDDTLRIVLVEYQFVYGSAPTVVQAIDEQGWDDAYPTYGPFTSNEYPPYGGEEAVALAASMQTTFNPTPTFPLWDVGVHDPETNVFWWSGGGGTWTTDYDSFFSQFDTDFTNRMRSAGDVPGGGTLVGATPPFLKLAFDNEAAALSGQGRVFCQEIRT